MSTSDVIHGGSSFEGIDAATGLNAAGLPDPSVLERLANDYLKQTGFTSAPQGSTTTVAPYAARVLPVDLPAAPYNAVPFGSFLQPPTSIPAAVQPTVLTAGQLESLPTSLTHDILTPLPYFSAPPAPHGPTDPASFSFLQNIRPPAFAPVAIAAPLPTVKLPTDTPISAVDAGLNGKAFDISERTAAEAAAPILPGADSPVRQANESLNYAFVHDLRRLASFDAVPSLDAFDQHADPRSMTSLASAPYDVNAVRRSFPILEERINGRQLVWLDNAATTQKPLAVIDRISYYYLHENSNIHRAAHTLAARSTDAYEGARDRVAKFLNAPTSANIIFVRGATEGINLIAQTYGKKNLQKDDEVVITWLEHHANIVPWQMICAEKGARLRVVPTDKSGQVLLAEYEKLLGPRTKIVSIAQVSNALGTILPVTEMTAAAHRYGAKVLVDGAQAVSHMPVDVQAIDCDFYVFSGHKVFAPTGIGAVYGKQDVLEHMPPYQGGGNMIVDVTFEKTVYHLPPGRFEAGTGSIAPAVGLGAAIDFLSSLGMHNIARYEHDLLQYAIAALSAIPGLHLIGTAKEKASVLSFVLDGFRNEDVGHALNQEGIAIRSGHHCAQPILRRYGLEGTVRPSLALYNTCEEVDQLVAAIWNIKNGRTSSVV